MSLKRCCAGRSWKFMNFVFYIVKNNAKTKSMALDTLTKPDQGSAASVPSVLFSHWREMLNQTSLDGPTRAGYTAAIEGWLNSQG